MVREDFWFNFNTVVDQSFESHMEELYEHNRTLSL